MHDKNEPLGGFRRGRDVGAILNFRAELHRLGHSIGTIDNYTHSARHLAAWADQEGLALTGITADLFDRFVRHRCQCVGGKARSVSALSSKRAWRFVCHVTGRWPAPQLHASPPVRPLTAVFMQWQLDHGGLSPHTVETNGRLVERWLARLGEDPADYSAAGLRDAVIAESEGISTVALKRSISALRAYLRYLTFRRMCPEDLVSAVPSVAHWRLSTLPRYLPGDKVEALIDSCDIASAAGLRDRAILLLLARLALRAGDVATLKLGDLRWSEGKIKVAGKGRRDTLLPLSQEVGDALLAYLERGRPPSPSDRVFLRATAPWRAFRNGNTVSVIVRRALGRAGITDAPSRGAHLLRHSAATSLLRNGATLETIGVVLRHKSMDSTAIYAKVDHAMLAAIAEPWPGATSC